MRLTLMALAMPAINYPKGSSAMEDRPRRGNGDRSLVGYPMTNADIKLPGLWIPGALAHFTENPTPRRTTF